MRLLKLFMWGYQHHFRTSLELVSERVLTAIGVETKPRALLIGVRHPDKPGPNPVCVEPEFETWPLSLFDGLPDEIEATYKTHDAHKIFYSDERSMEEKPEKIRRSVVRAEVLRRLKPFDDEFNVTSFAGSARLVGDYHVVPILQLPRAAIARYTQLKTEKAYFRDYHPQASYLHACVYEVLAGASRELEYAEPGYGDFDGNRSNEEITRQAAITFLKSPLLVTARQGKMEEAFWIDLFAILNAVSSHMYEHTPGVGRMLIANPENPNVTFRLRFPKPISFRDTRWVRKLLQMAGGENSLIVNGGGIWGLGTLTRFDPEAEDTFWVDIIGHSQWNLRLDANIIFQSKLGQPSVLVEAITKDRFIDNFRRILPGTTDAQATLAWEHMQAAIKEPGGSMVIYAVDAATEAERLSKQGMVVTPVPLTSDLVTSFSKIDGSVLCSPDGVCHAIGVILDGAANENCLPSRGSRYNSAIRYVLATSPPRLAVVRSDDGELDVIPLLMPRIQRSEFVSAIEALEKATKNNYYKPRLYLDHHRFYALPEDCVRINAALGRIAAFPQEVGEIRLATQPFQPNPAMEPEYFV